MTNVVTNRHSRGETVRLPAGQKIRRRDTRGCGATKGRGSLASPALLEFQNPPEDNHALLRADEGQLLVQPLLYYFAIGVGPRGHREAGPAREFWSDRCLFAPTAEQMLAAPNSARTAARRRAVNRPARRRLSPPLNRLRGPAMQPANKAHREIPGPPGAGRNPSRTARAISRLPSPISLPLP